LAQRVSAGNWVDKLGELAAVVVVGAVVAEYISDQHDHD